MNSELVTVILPIYNVEKYLNRCIESVVSQTYTNLEIILIDDGSPDKCPAICDRWAEKDSRIKVIHKQNEGVGYARNSGLDIATGDYIYFVDPDDYIDENALGVLYTTIKESKADVVYCGTFEENGSSSVPKEYAYVGRTFMGDEIRNDLLMNMLGQPAIKKSVRLGVAVWQGIYRRALIEENKIRFPSEREYISEDNIFTFEVMTYANCVKCISGCYYHYTVNDNSLSHAYNPERFSLEKVKVMHKRLTMMSEEIGKKELYKERIAYSFLCDLIVCMKQAVANEKFSKSGMSKKVIKMIVEDHYVETILLDYPFRKDSFVRRILIILMRNKRVNLIRSVVKLSIGRK